MSTPKANAHTKLAALLKQQKEQEDERAVLLKKIEKLKLTVEGIDTSIAATKLEYARAHNEEICPVLRLPPEITHLIFNYAARSEPLAEIKVCHVCHRWRYLSLGFPDIWSRITHTFSERTHEAKASRLCRFLAYLERSRNWPLDLRFEVYSLEWCDGLTPMLFNFLTIAGKHALRWRRFSLEMIPPRPPFGANWDNKDLLTVFYKLSVPVLQLFEVILPSSPHLVPVHNNGDLQLSFSGIASKLALVRIDSLSFMRCTPPLNNLTTLQLENRVELRARIAFRIFLDVLNLTSSSLVNLMIGKGVFDSNQTRPASTRRASAMQLKNFLCADQNIAESMRLLVNVPVLELLIFREIWFDSFVEYGSYTSDSKTPTFFFPSLKTLALVDCVFDAPIDDFPLAHATRGIAHLHIYGGTLSLSRDLLLIPSLAQMNPTTIFWPDMQTFACSLTDYGEPSEMDYKSYLQQVQSRSRNLQTRCKLQLSRADAERWASAHPQSWEALQLGGYFEEISIDSRRRNEGILECAPWPLPNVWDRY